MPKIQVDLGHRAYLFKERQGYAPNVIISAHGYHLPNSGTLSPGFPTLKLYCAHGGTVDDVPDATLIRQQEPYETIPNGANVTTTDDFLFKYGEHSGAIKDHQKRLSSMGTKVTIKEAEQDLTSLGGEAYQKFKSINDLNNDYVTIRNRASVFGGPVIKLSELIRLINKKNAYREIKCAFCRESKEQNYVPNTKHQSD